MSYQDNSLTNLENHSVPIFEAGEYVCLTESWKKGRPEQQTGVQGHNLHILYVGDV